MRIALEQDFTNRNVYGGALLASYTAPRDMAVSVVVTLSTVGNLTLKAQIGGKTVGPTEQFSSAAGQLPGAVTNAQLFPLPLKSGQVLDVRVKSDNINDIGISGTVIIAEVDVPTEDRYTAVIERARNNGSDEWSVLFAKNGNPLTSGVTSPMLSVVQRSGGESLFAVKVLSPIGNTGAFKCDAAGDEQGDAGESLIATASATIDGATRTCPDVLVKDNTT